MFKSLFGKSYYYKEEKGLIDPASENEVQWAADEIRKAVVAATAVICTTVAGCTALLLYTR